MGVGLLAWLYVKTSVQYLQLSYPKGVPFFGNLFQLQPHRSFLRLDEWAKELGNVFALRLVSKNLVVVSDYQHIREVLITRGQVFGGRPRGSLRMDLLSQGQQDIGFSEPSATFWNPVRKVVHSQLKLHGGGGSHLDEIFHLAGEDVFDEIRKLRGEPVDIKSIIYNFTVRSILIISLGKAISDDEDISNKMKEMEQRAAAAMDLNGEGATLDAFPWLKYFGNKTYRHLAQGRIDLREIYKTVKSTIISHMDEDKPTNVTEALLANEGKLKDVYGNPLYSDINIMANLNNLLLAGVSTTTRSLYAFINILLHHKDVVEKMQKELDAVMGMRKEVTGEDRDKMPYMRACLLELQRYATVNASGLPHCAVEDTTLAGSRIPKGTVIVVNLWTMHHDEKLWGDPWRFRPGRYLTDDGQLVPPDHPNRVHLLTFSAGPRVCVGEQFASRRLFFFLTNLLLRFDMDCYNPVSCDPHGYIADTNLLQKPYKICLTPRNKKHAGSKTG